MASCAKRTVDGIEQRTLTAACLIIETGCTVRQAAKELCISKSTVHKDVTQRLFHINRELWRQACNVLAVNKSQRHLRGGLATRKKYMALRGMRRGKACRGTNLGDNA